MSAKARRLKAQPIGDFFRGRVVPQIRLQGQWLKRAGFIPGAYVLVTLKENGVLEIQIEPPDRDQIK